MASRDPCQRMENSWGSVIPSEPVPQCRNRNRCSHRHALGGRCLATHASAFEVLCVQSALLTPFDCRSETADEVCDRLAVLADGQAGQIQFSRGGCVRERQVSRRHCGCRPRRSVIRRAEREPGSSAGMVSWINFDSWATERLPSRGWSNSSSTPSPLSPWQ